jgi:hypothetical protein
MGLPLLFVLPFVFGLLAKIHRSKPWFGDYQAVSCAGLKDLAHQPFYDLNMACPGMHASVFVYIPVVAHVTAWFEGLLSEPGFFVLYAALFVASLAALIVVPLKWAPGTLRQKLPFAVFIGSAAVTWGNVAVLLHGAILGAALLLETTPWVFIAAVAIAAAVKPIFLTYLAVILLARMSWVKRLTLTAVGVAAGLAPTIVFTLTDPGTAYQWAHLLSHFVYDVTPGSGFYGWLAFFGARANTPAAQVAYLIYAGALMLSAFAAVYRLKLDDRERLWLGLCIAGLLIPRIMSQDVFLLAPGLVVVAQRGVALAGATPVGLFGKARHFLLSQGPHIVFGLCALALIFGPIGHSHYSNPLALLGLSLYLIGLGLTLARGEQLADTMVRRPWRALTPARAVNSETQA